VPRHEEEGLIIPTKDKKALAQHCYCWLFWIFDSNTGTSAACLELIAVLRYDVSSKFAGYMLQISSSPLYYVGCINMLLKIFLVLKQQGKALESLASIVSTK
jgi:hypothetical protein